MSLGRRRPWRITCRKLRCLWLYGRTTFSSKFIRWRSWTSKCLWNRLNSATNLTMSSSSWGRRTKKLFKMWKSTEKTCKRVCPWGMSWERTSLRSPKLFATWLSLKPSLQLWSNRTKSIGKTDHHFLLSKILKVKPSKKCTSRSLMSLQQSTSSVTHSRGRTSSTAGESRSRLSSSSTSRPRRSSFKPSRTRLIK